MTVDCPQTPGAFKAAHGAILKWLARVVVIDAGIAIAVPLFQSFFDARVTLGVLARQYLFSVIYSNLIGIPLFLILPPVWARTSSQSLALRSAVRGGVVLITNFAGCLLAGLILRSIIGPQYRYWSDFRGSFGLSLVLSAIVVAFVSMYETQQSKLRRTSLQLKNNELERERALKLATEARLSSLESRIHPHFLFNTINSVSSLIPEDPVRAEKILLQLSELLRFSLDVAPGGLVPLARELQIVEDYLEIERARFGPRLAFDIRVPHHLRDLRVPPLSVQTLVENSVKYAVAPRARGANLLISAAETPNCLKLQVQDDGPGFRSFELPAGHGLNNLQERMRALFGESAKLEITRNGAPTIVTIEIPRPSSRSSHEPYAAAFEARRNSLSGHESISRLPG